MATSTGSGVDQAITSALIYPTVVSTSAGSLPWERLLPAQTIRSIVAILALGAALLASSVTLVMAEQASAQSHSERALAGRIDAGNSHTCAILEGGSFGGGKVRCWGDGGAGQLGYPGLQIVAGLITVGLHSRPALFGPVALGAGGTATAIAIAAGDSHTCAILGSTILGGHGGEVRCWGEGLHGQLGYANPDAVGDDETPGSVGTVDLGPGRTATAITAGARHTCAILDNRKVRCWGFNEYGQLGYGHTNSFPDQIDETPGDVDPVDLGAGHTAIAIAAGGFHTCVILGNGEVRCWGSNSDGQLGYANTDNVGDDETPGSVGTVDLGPGRTATHIAAGDFHTCAILDNATVLCWGWGALGRLGYANTQDIGDDETPGSVGPVDIGGPATAITAGGWHTCVVLEGGRVRCWGYGGRGQLGYANFPPFGDAVGDNETPSSIGPVSLGGLVTGGFIQGP